MKGPVTVVSIPLLLILSDNRESLSRLSWLYFGICRTHSDVLRPQRPDPHPATLGAFSHHCTVEEGKGRREKSTRSAVRVDLFAGPDSFHREPRGAPHSPSVSSLSRVSLSLTPINIQLDTRSLRSTRQYTRNLSRKPIRILPKIS